MPFSSYQITAVNHTQQTAANPNSPLRRTHSHTEESLSLSVGNLSPKGPRFRVWDRPPVSVSRA
jgi:hypothetical protein